MRVTVVASDEGTISPNTAAVQITDVTNGRAVQGWKLDATQSSSFTVKYVP